MAKCTIRKDLQGLQVPVVSIDGIESFIDVKGEINYEWTEDCDSTGQIYITIDNVKYRADSIDFDFLN